MRTYEALYIIRPDLEDDAVQTVAQGVEKLITGDGGAIVRSEIWGKRRLAYEVKKFSEGVYVLVRFESQQKLVDILERHFRLNDDIIRFLVVHLDKKTLRLETEQQRRSKAQAEARAAAGGSRDEDGPPRRRDMGSRAASEETVEA